MRLLGSLTRRGRRPWLVWGVTASLPFVVIGLASRRELATWLVAGTCPGGPMDRRAAPCGPLEFFGIVFLGGWAAPFVVPVLAVWWALATSRLVYTLRRKAGVQAEGSAEGIEP